MRLFTTAVVALLLFIGLGSGWPVGGASVAYAQQDSTVLAQIEHAFRSSDVEALLSRAANRVDVVIFGKGASYSREQATLVLLDFFRRNPPRRVIFEQQVLADDRRSMVGHYQIAGGEEPVSISVRLRERGGEWQVRAVRIEQRGR